MLTGSQNETFVLFAALFVVWAITFGFAVRCEFKAEPLPQPKIKTIPLPQKCAYLLREPDPETWDPKTDTYPRNIEWEKCMGVH